MRISKITTVFFFTTAVLFVLVSYNSCFANADKIAGGLSFLKSKQILRVGMSGREVSDLQIYLADLSIYPRNFITGYFGRVTELAVKVFQLKNGIGAAGVVGPKTKARINALLSSIDHLPQPLLVATSSQIGNVVTNTATSSESVQYSLQTKPGYDFKSLAKAIQNLINDKRDEFRLGPIYWDDELAFVAEEHSSDQAKDNLELTKSVAVCHYPMIRHEGFTILGYSLKERFLSRNIKYKYGGENIAMIPVSKNLFYLHPANEPLVKCIDAPKFLPGDGTVEERTNLFRVVFNGSLEAVKNLESVNWVNREWWSEKELAEMAVDGWMNSPGHRENILRKEFTLGGVGIATVNDYIIITHNFAGR